MLKIDSDKNEIIVGPREKLGRKKINLKNLNLLVNNDEFKDKILVKVRSTGKMLDAFVKFKNENLAEVDLVHLEDGISPGQACVFYKKNENGYKVLGGGWIKS